MQPTTFAKKSSARERAARRAVGTRLSEPQILFDGPSAGLRRPGAQLAWLRSNGWPVERDARGRPRLLRAVVESRLGAVPVQQQAGPRWEALRG